MEGGGGGVNFHFPCPRHEVPSGGRVREVGVPHPHLERKLKSGNAKMIFEAHQNLYFVRLYCINILTKHILTTTLNKRPFGLTAPLSNCLCYTNDV